MARLRDQPAAWTYPSGIIRCLECIPVALIQDFINRRSHRHRCYQDLWWEWRGAISDVHAIKKPGISRKSIRLITQQRLPLVYALGYVEFMGLGLSIRPPLLIPRPDTAAWLQQAIPYIRQAGCRTAVDLGCGAGTISLAIAKELNINVTGIDSSNVAVRLAKANAQKNNISNCIFIKTDMRTFNGKFDLVISNPPYIPRIRRVPDVSPSTRRWESHSALHPPVHDDGTYYHRAMMESIKNETFGGCKVLVMELDGTKKQFDIVKGLMLFHRFRDVIPLSDGRSPYRAILGYPQ